MTDSTMKEAILTSRPIHDDSERNSRVSFGELFDLAREGVIERSDIRRVTGQMTSEGLIEEYEFGRLRLTQKGERLKRYIRS